VGLLAEEYDSRAQRAVGNFPQAFSHIALVNTAYNIAATRKPCEQRSGNPSLAGAAAVEQEEVLEVLLEQRSTSTRAGSQ
jgi:hypothetical protein